MQTNNTYKYLSIILAIIALIFAILYFTKPTAPVMDTIGDITADVKACRDDLAAWQQAHSGQATTSDTEKAELNTIIEKCKNTLENSQDNI
jgi:hypothetical protein